VGNFTFHKWVALNSIWEQRKRFDFVETAIKIGNKGKGLSYEKLREILRLPLVQGSHRWNMLQLPSGLRTDLDFFDPKNQRASRGMTGFSIENAVLPNLPTYSRAHKR